MTAEGRTGGYVLGGTRKLWLLLRLQISYLALNGSLVMLNPEALVRLTQLAPVVRIFGHPIRDPLSMLLALSQVIDLFA